MSAAVAGSAVFGPETDEAADRLSEYARSECGFDPDERPDIYGKVGTSGVSIATLEEFGDDRRVPSGLARLTTTAEDLDTRQDQKRDDPRRHARELVGDVRRPWLLPRIAIDCVAAGLGTPSSRRSAGWRSAIPARPQTVQGIPSSRRVRSPSASIPRAKEGLRLRGARQEKGGGHRSHRLFHGGYHSFAR